MEKLPDVHVTVAYGIGGYFAVVMKRDGDMFIPQYLDTYYFKDEAKAQTRAILWADEQELPVCLDV